VNEAALKQAKEDRKLLERNDFEYALEKVIM
jgi:ATP-dependent Zn protease